MSKKDFKASINPASMFITPSIIEPQEQPQGQAKTKQSREEAVRNDKKAGSKEAKSKRLNLLLQPSLLEDLSKIATMKKDSVNNLINTVMSEYRDKHKDIIKKHDSIFGE